MSQQASADKTAVIEDRVSRETRKLLQMFGRATPFSGASLAPIKLDGSGM